MNNRRVPLYVGIALALGTGLLLLNYLTRLQQRPTLATRSVLVALSDIPARSTLKPELVSVTVRQATQVDPDALSDPRAVVGKMALITIPAGSVVTQSKIGRASELALPVRLAHGMRAVSIAVDRVKDVSGLVQPGDRVDVIAAPARAGDAVPKVSTILRAVLVLAVGSATEIASAAPPASNAEVTTVTLALTPQQANLLVLADTNTTLRLALRSPEELARAFPPEPLELSAGQVAQSGPGPVPAPMAAAPAPMVASVDRFAPPPPPAVSKWAGFSVPILDGDRFVTNTQGGH